MTVLVDTHALIWWLEAGKRLSRSAAAILANRESRILVSAAVAWELAIKVNLGKIQSPVSMRDFSSVVQQQRFVELAISVDHAVEAGLLPRHHGDPFDRVLIAQARALAIPIVSGDALFDRYGVERLW